MAYVEGFVVPVPKGRIEDYKAMATLAQTVWKEFGALDYVECLADDTPHGELTSFPRAVQLKEDEIAVFAWIVYASREQRDQIQSKIISDPRFKVWEDKLPFDGKRMIWGGFTPLVGL